MSQNKYLFSFTLILILISQLNCKKDTATSKTRTQLLTAQNWKVVAYRHSYNNSGWWNDFAEMPDCSKDDIFKFNSNFTYTLDQGVLKCSPWGPQIIRQSTWEFLANESKLFTYDTTGREIVEIKQLDETNLITIRKDTAGSGTYITEVTYIH